MAAQEMATMEKDLDPTSTTNPLNTIDGNSGPAFAFAKLNTSDLEMVGAGALIANRSDQAHYEIIMWTSRDYRVLLSLASMLETDTVDSHRLVYPLPEDVQALDNNYNFTAHLANESYVSLSSYLLAPLTSGNISINSTEAADTPLINLPVGTHGLKRDKGPY
jgi:hypothetical protein